eukprot:16657_1
MTLALQTLGDRTQKSMIYEFWKPQMFINSAINAVLNTELLDKNAANDSSYKYDYYMQQFSDHKHVDNVWSLFLYNDDTNLLIGAARSTGSDDHEIHLIVYDDSCLIEYGYDTTKQMRDINNINLVDCSYDPRSRPWYKLSDDMSSDIDYNISRSGWTHPYEFAGSQGDIGISFVAPIIDSDGTLLIFLCEMSVTSLSNSFQDTFTSIPVGTVLMIATPSINDTSLDVIVSSTNDTLINNLRSTDNELITDTINYLKENSNIDNDKDIKNMLYDENKGYYFSLYPFSSLYLDLYGDTADNLILNKTEWEYGYVIIANDLSYLGLVDTASTISIIITIIMIIISFLNICWQINYYQQKTKNNGNLTRSEYILSGSIKRNIAFNTFIKTQTVSSLSLSYSARSTSPKASPKPSTQANIGLAPIKSVSIGLDSPIFEDGDGLTPNINDDESAYEEVMSSMKNSSSPKNTNYRAKFVFCHCSKNILLMFTLFQILFTCVLITIIWEYMSSASIHRLFNNVISKHEFNIVSDEIYYIFETSDMVEQTFQQNFKTIIDDSVNSKSSMDHFMINMMKSYLQPSYPFDFRPWAIYYGTPAGDFVGTFRDPNDDTLGHVRRDKTTNWIREFVTIATGDIPDYSAPYYYDPLMDPRCRPWYEDALKNSFTGKANDAYPNDTFYNFIYDTKQPSLTHNCEEAKSSIQDFYGIWSNNSNDFTNFDKSLFTNNTKYSLIWSRYIFGDQASIGITASSTIIDENGKLLAVIAIDWLLSALSENLKTFVETESSDDGVGSNEYIWIFESNKNEPAMIASSDLKTITDTSHLEGCLSFTGGSSNEEIPYLAIEHPTYTIRVMSKEIVNVHGIETLPVNSLYSSSIKIPIDLPHLEAGRISYYLEDKNQDINFNLDWSLSRTINQSKIEIDDIRFAVILIGSIAFAVALLFSKYIKDNKEDNDDDDNEQEEQENEEANQDENIENSK